MGAVLKKLKPNQEDCKIYYRKGFFSPFGEDMEKMKAGFDVNDYEMVCHYPVWRAPGHNDGHILQAIFELFNWFHEGFQPQNEKLGFHRPDTVYHTSISAGDVVEISGQKYLCDNIGWIKIKG